MFIALQHSAVASLLALALFATGPVRREPPVESFEARVVRVVQIVRQVVVARLQVLAQRRPGPDRPGGVP